MRSALFAALGLGLGVVLLVPFVPGCGGSDCDSSECGAGNACVDDGTGVRCQRVCQNPEGCPANFHCASAADGQTGYCAADKQAYVQGAGTRPWGASCLPSQGIENPACDLANEFRCQAERPSDANAYCTRFDCASDDDCGGGYYCEHINNAPNAQTTKRSFGVDRTLTACLKRTYCAPCKGDAECEPIDGAKAYCVPDDKGQKFCTKECDSDRACRSDATCVSIRGKQMCKPRAGVCRGDGSFCSPCFSDFDCTDGICFVGPYSNERACSVKSPTACVSGKPTACPKEAPGTLVTSVGCATENSAEFPKDSCVPFVPFLKGSSGEDQETYGCWAAKP
jgi:hypothetical protein